MINKLCIKVGAKELDIRSIIEIVEIEKIVFKAIVLNEINKYKKMI